MLIGIGIGVGRQRFAEGFVGLLDTYSGAAAAYSLRKLRTAYTGNAIRVRRASDNTEQNIGFVNNVLDTASLTSFCSGTNGFVTTWYDQSGNGRDATQTTAANQPQIVSSGSVILESNKACISSPNGYLTLSRTWAISLSNPQLFYVGKITTLYQFNYSGHWIDLGNDGINNHFINDSGDTGTHQDIFSASRKKYGTFNANLNQRYLECYEHVTTTTTRYLNGIDRGSLANTLVTPNNLIIGGSSSQYPSTGTIQEVIIYATGNSSNRTGIETNINNFYSIY